MRPPLLLAAAAIVLLATTGCVSLPDHGSPRAPDRSPEVHTVAPARPSAQLTPTQEPPREQVVAVGGARAAESHVRQEKAPAREDAPRQRAQQPRRWQAPRARHVPRQRVRERPTSAPAPVRQKPKRPTAAAPSPRATVDSRVVCHLASGNVRADLMRLCRGMYGR
ncbi:hypothetical protein [Streptomyces sp. NPDC017993]|uniref:hypothetical protein n=1 Tax=Streptomyces sp. NPDC017993 TaxID=3365027 RepID=UPI0037ACC7E0